MALPKITPKKASKRIVRNTSRSKLDLGPNPFLDSKAPGNLEESYKQFKANKIVDATFEVTVPGARETYTMKRGASKGKPGTRLTGDADLVVRLLRDGADQLGIGVSVTAEDAVDEKGKKIPGHMTVIYQAKERKAPRTAKPAPAPAPAPAAPQAQKTA